MDTQMHHLLSSNSSYYTTRAYHVWNELHYFSLILKFDLAFDKKITD